MMVLKREVITANMIITEIPKSYPKRNVVGNFLTLKILVIFSDYFSSLSIFEIVD